MKAKYLFPNHFKKIGWALIIPGIVLGVLFLIYQSNIPFFDTTVFAVAEDPIFSSSRYFSISENNVLDETACILFILGALFIAFAKERNEDEFIAKIRLESLVWATYINYGVLILSMIFVYELSFFWVLVGNMFTLLVFFLIRFNWIMSTAKNQLNDEE